MSQQASNREATFFVIAGLAIGPSAQLKLLSQTAQVVKHVCVSYVMFWRQPIGVKMFVVLQEVKWYTEFQC